MEWSEFMEGFWRRHPECRGQGPESVTLIEKKAISVRQEAIVEAPKRDLKQETSDHDDGDAWDGQEPEEEPK
jgi:hypothetical protein